MKKLLFVPLTLIVALHCAGKGGTPGSILSEPPPLPPIDPLALALDVSGITLSQSAGSNEDWFNQRAESNDGLDALQSGALQDSQRSCFEGALSTPGAIAFSWKVSSQEDDSLGNGDFLRFYIDGEQQSEISGEQDWGIVDYIFTSSGERIIRWCYEKDASGADNMDTSWVDQLVLTPFDEEYSENVQNALDDLSALFNFAVSLESDADWYGQTTESRDGTDALQSGAIADGQSSCLETSLSGPNRVVFDWKLSSDSSDFLRFYVGDVARPIVLGTSQVEEISGDKDWSSVEYIEPAPDAGTYTLKWCYEKDAVVAANMDTAWLDRVEVSPYDTAFSADVTAALDYGSSFDFHSSPTSNALWLSQSVETNDGTDALESGNITHGQTSCFESLLQGPVNINFDWKTSSQDGGDYLRFYVNNRKQDEFSGDLGWQRTGHVIPASVQYRIKWCYEKDVSVTANNDRAWLDQLAVGSFSPIAADAALDTAVSITLTGSDAEWFGQENIHNDGVDALESGELGDSQNSCFETDVIGPVSIDFDWKTESEENADYLKFYIDDIERLSLSGRLDWETVSYALNSSTTHTLKWCYEKNASNAAASDRAWVDSFSTSVLTTIPAATALGTANSVSFSGDADWYGQTGTYYDDSAGGGSNNDAVQSGLIGNNEQSCFETNVTGPNRIRFRWKVDSEASADYLRFYAGSSQIKEISGNQGWNLIEYAYNSSASQVFKWCYEKNSSGISGADRAWVDSLELVNTVGAALALDTTQAITDSSANDAHWYGQTTFTNDSVDALQSGLLGDNEQSCFETNVTGPGRIRFYWKVDSEASADYLRFYAGTSQIKEISGNQSWAQVEHLLTGSATETLKWCYEKNASGVSGADTAWVDSLELTSTVASDAALDTSQTITNSVGNNGNWYGQTAVYYNDSVNGGSNDDALQSGLIGDNEQSCFETDVSGPSRVRFRWEVDSEANADYLRFYVGSSQIKEISGSQSWAQVEHLLTTNSTETLKWCYEKNGSGASGADTAWVDALELASTVTSDAALDTAQTITDSAGNNGNWYGQTSAYYDDSAVGGSNDDALQSGLLGDNEKSCFETDVTGPRHIRFRWEVDSEANADYLRFYVGSSQIKEISGSQSWAQVEYLLTTSATETLKWCYEKNLSGVSGADRAWVDALELASTVASAIALDTAQIITDSAGNNGNWYGQTSAYYDDSAVGGSNDDAVQSGLLGDNEKSCFETDVTGPRHIRFRWEVDSEANADYLRFYVGSSVTPVKEISGSQSWAQVEYLLTTSATETLKWCYEKSASGASGADRAWVDALELASTVASAIALDTAQTITDSAGNNGNWYGQTAVYYNDSVNGGSNDDALQSGLLGDSEQSCFETDVTGPMRIRFRWEVDSEANADYLRFYVGSSQIKEISGNQSWAQVEHLLTGSATETLKWCYEKNGSGASGADTAWVDALELASTVASGAALDTAQTITDSVGNNGNWYGQTTTYYNDGGTNTDALQSGLLGDNEKSCFETDVTGPMRIRFRWEVDSEAGADYLRFYVGSSVTPVKEISGNQSWAQVEHLLTGSATETLKWCYEKNGSGASGADTAWVDALELASTVASGAALDTAQTITDSVGNNGNWYGQTTTYYNDGGTNTDALQSGLLGDNEKSCFETDVTGPMRIRFRWEVDSEAGADYLRFYVGSSVTPVKEISGSQSWAQVEYLLTTSTTETLKWCYEKNASGASGADTAWVDALELAATVASDAALDTAQTITDSAGNNGDWYGQTTTYYNDGGTNTDALQSGLLGDSEQSCFETDVTGPMRIRFRWEVDSEANADYLRFYVGSSQIKEISGSQSWAQVEYLLTTSTTETLKWCYEKSASGASGADTAWVDALELAATVGAAIALDTAQTITDSAGNNGNWYGQTAVHYNDGGTNTDALQSGLLGDSEQSCFETDVTGPMRIRFRWEVDSEANADYLRFYVGSSQIKEISGSQSWAQVEHLLTGNATETLKWCYEKNASGVSGADTAWVDALELASTVASAIALDTAQTITDSAGNNGNWYGQTSAYYDDSAVGGSNDDALQSGLLGDSEQSCFETDVTGPIVVSFRWKVDSEASADYLRFYVGSSQIKEISGSQSWAQVEHLLTTNSTETLKWCYEKNGSGASGADTAWVDALELAATVGAAIALDTSQTITDSAGNNGNWYGQTAVYYNDSVNGGSNDDALQSDLLGDSEQSCFETDVTGPMRIRFRWEVDSEANADYLRFYVGSSQIKEISGSQSWAQVEYLLTTSTTETLKWCYEKNGSGASGADTAWVDALELASTVASAIALDTAQIITDSAGNNGNWYGQTSAYYDDSAVGGSNDDAVQSGLLGDNEQSCFETDVTGPMRIRFRWEVDSEANADYLRFYVGSSQIKEISGSQSWAQVEHLLTGNATETLKWCYEKNGSGASGADTAWVDALELASTVASAIALDTAQTITDSAGNNGNWYGQTSAYYDDSAVGGSNDDALQSGLLGDSEQSCFETDVTGPMRIRFRWEVDSEANADYLRFYVGSSQIKEISGSQSWAQVEHLLTGNATETLKWCYEKSASGASGADTAWVDALELASTVASATALDTAQTITDSAGNNGNWYGQTTTYYNDGGTNTDALQSGLLGDNEKSCFETDVTGPMRIRFRWEVDSEASADYLRFYAGSSQIKEISGSQSWAQVEYLLTTSTTETLKWCYEKSASGASGADTAWVDALELAATVGAAIALDTSQTITDSAGNNGNWYGQTAVYYNDSVNGGSNDDAVQSGPIGDSEQSCFETNVTGPIVVSFRWKVDSEAGADYLNFYVDNYAMPEQQISGDVDWTSFTHLVTVGSSYNLKWCYEKNGSGVSGADAAWVDSLELANIVGAAIALDTTRTITDSVGNDANWYGQTAIKNDGVDALQSGPLGTSEESCFETDVTGPKRVRFHWKVDSESASDYLKFYVGTSPIEQISGDQDWVQEEYLYRGSGSIALKWCYEKDTGGASGADAAWVDELEISNIVDSDTALDTTQAIINSGGNDKDWYGQSAIANDGTDALQSGLIRDNQKSCFQMSVNGSKRIRFHWKVDSESASDYLNFYAGTSTTPVQQISGNQNWHQKEYILKASGSSTFKWCYEKDAAGSGGSDAAWVDEIRLSNVVASDLSLDTSQTITDSTGNDTDWYGQKINYYNTGGANDDALQSGFVGDGEKSCFETNVAGPKRVRFQWKVDSEANADYLRFYVSASQIEQISGNQNWTQAEYLLTSSSTETLKWCYEKNASSSSGSDAGWLDRLELADIVDSDTALDTSQVITDSVGNNANWYGQRISYYNDGGTNNDALQSGLLGNGEKSCFETSVAGANDIRFRWQVSSEQGGDYLRYYVDGVLKEEISGDISWTSFNGSLLGAGSHTLKWCYEKNGSGAANSDRAWVDILEVSSITIIVDAEALDDLSLNITNPASHPITNLPAEAWYGQTSVTQNGGDALKSVAITDSEISCFQTDISVGAGQRAEISFYWKVFSELNADYLIFYVDSVSIREVSGNVDWAEVEYTLGDNSSYELKWCYEKDAANSIGEDSAWLDWIQVNFITPVTIEVALDDPMLSITNAAVDPNTSNPTTAWFTQDDYSQNGGSALQSGFVGDGQSSCFENSVTGPKDISFYWKASSQENGDYLRFYVDDAEQASISGDVDWRQFRYILEASGTHILKWCYQKNASFSGALDSAWVDALTLTDPLDAKEALDAASSGLNLNDLSISYPASYPAPNPADPAIPNTPWFGEADTNHNGGDVMRSGSIGDGEISCFEAQITQTPSSGHRYEVSFYWQLSSAENSDYLKFYIDGSEVDQISGPVSRRQVRHFLAADSTAVLKWCYEKDAISNSYATEDRAWLDQIGFVEHAVLSPEDALDTATLTITNPSSAPPNSLAWLGQTNVYQSAISGNDDALQSAQVGNGQSSCFETQVTGPGSVQFHWKLSSQIGSDYLRLYEYDSATPPMNPVAVEEISGNVDWTVLEYIVESAGSRTLKWCYEKDGSGEAGDDRAWLDALLFTSDDGAAALDVTGSLANSYTTPVASPPVNSAWIAQKTHYEDSISGNDDALQSGQIGDAENACFELTVPVLAANSLQVWFYWKLSSQPSSDYLRFYIDNVEQASISGDIDWEQKSYSLYNSSTSNVDYIVKWCYEKDASGASGLDRAWVDGVRTEGPYAAPSFGNILDYTATPVTASAGNQGQWVSEVITLVCQDAIDCLTAENTGNNEESCFETSITGPQRVRFYWSTDTQPNADYLRFYEYDSLNPPANPVPVEQISGNKNWTEVDYVVTDSGSRILKWCYEKDAAWIGGFDRARVDGLRVTSPISFTNALDISGQSFTTPSGSSAWFGQANRSNDGNDALQSASIADNQNSCFETNVAGNDVFFVNFYWKADSEADADYLKLYVNGAAAREISGDQSWTKVEFVLGPRPVDINTGMSPDHTLRWCYEKNTSGSSGADAAWVDEMYISATLPPPTMDTASSAGLQMALATTDALSLSGDEDWFGTQRSNLANIVSESYARSGLVGHNQSSCLTRTLNVTGISKLEFAWSVSSEADADYLKFYIDNDANDGTDNYLEMRAQSVEMWILPKL